MAPVVGDGEADVEVLVRGELRREADIDFIVRSPLLPNRSIRAFDVAALASLKIALLSHATARPSPLSASAMSDCEAALAAELGPSRRSKRSSVLPILIGAPPAMMCPARAGSPMSSAMIPPMLVPSAVTAAGATPSSSRSRTMSSTAASRPSSRRRGPTKRCSIAADQELMGVDVLQARGERAVRARAVRAQTREEHEQAIGATRALVQPVGDRRVPDLKMTLLTPSESTRRPRLADRAAIFNCRLDDQNFPRPA